LIEISEKLREKYRGEMKLEGDIAKMLPEERLISETLLEKMRLQ
jgi:hypothetical protein